MPGIGTRTAGGAPPRVSVVIPTLDEEARIGDLLAELSGLERIHEVVVVDGGSSDRTVELARSASGTRVVASRRGRAVQMNAGARMATGDVLLFLHADVRLPPDALDHVAAALADPDVVAGAFRTWTVADAGPTWLAPFLHLADMRSRYTKLPYGDQALFIRASVFQALGGFSALRLMEDLEFARRLRQVGKIRTVPAAVRVSGRRFMTNPFYYALVMMIFPVLFRLGVPARTLERWYGNPRQRGPLPGGL